uniref:Fibronectin type-III domain-containing protein n=1 Tax=Periophthalmus magnuspinnatus TaxID=409849 RepID=A0A3B3ZAD0_9GOBI
MKDGVSVRAGDTIVITASKIVGKPPPSSAWSKGGREFKNSEVVSITTTPTSSTIAIKYASRKNTGDYVITASNPFGIKEEHVKVKVLDNPGPPGPVEASNISAEKCTLTWLPPEEDGGSSIKSYILEKRETNPPGPPSNPRIVETTKTTASFAWGRPHYDGGLEVEGYIVEYKKEGHDDWETETQYPIKVTEYVIGKLQKGGKYHFRVKAVNSEGTGEPAEVEKVTELVDLESLPDFELDAELRRTLVVRCRASIRMFVPIKGRPVPEVTWSKDDTNLKTRAHIDTTESYTLLIIPDCTRYDAGKYNLCLENVAGKKTGFVNVKVLDTPGPPNLYVTDVTADSASLSWTKPLHDGGSLITGYVIEYQKKDTDQWVHATTVKALDYTVADLIEGAEYTFRIMAVNASGRSDPRESRPAVIKEQTSAPSFDMRAVYQQTVIAKARDRVKVEIPVLGKPRPLVTWKKGDVVLKETQRINVETTPTSTILNIGEIKRSDGGQYSMTGKNLLGTVTETITILVHDIPGPPTGPIKLDEEVKY